MGKIIVFKNTRTNNAVDSTAEEARKAIQLIINLQKCSVSLFSFELPMSVLSRLELDMRILLKSLDNLRRE